MTAVLHYLGFEKLATVGVQPRKRALLVGTHQSVVTGDAACKNGSRPAFDARVGH